MSEFTYGKPQRTCCVMPSAFTTRHWQVLLPVLTNHVCAYVFQCHVVVICPTDHTWKVQWTAAQSSDVMMCKVFQGEREEKNYNQYLTIPSVPLRGLNIKQFVSLYISFFSIYTHDIQWTLWHHFLGQLYIWDSMQDNLTWCIVF